MSTYHGMYVYQDSLGLLALNAAIMAARGSAGPSYANSGSRPAAPCGTPAAARRHWRHHEPLCEACRAASNRDRQARGQARRAAALATAARTSTEGEAA